MDQDDRTSPPTERRRRQAREQGLGPRSHDLGLACRMLGLAAGLQFCGPGIVLGLSELVSSAFQSPVASNPTIETFVAQLVRAATATALPVGGMCAWILGSGLIGRMAQVGLRFDFAEFTPDLGRINPANGFAKILRTANVSLAVWSFVKFSVLIGVGGWFAWSRLGQSVQLMEEDVASSSILVGEFILSLTWILAVLQLVIGCIDYAWQYWKFEQSLLMTPEEQRAER